MFDVRVVPFGQKVAQRRHDAWWNLIIRRRAAVLSHLYVAHGPVQIWGSLMVAVSLHANL